MTLPFHTLINYLCGDNKQLVYQNPVTNVPNHHLFDYPNCQIITSYQDNFSIINALLNSLTIYPTDYSRCKQSLKDFFINYVIIHETVLKEFQLNPTKLTYYLDSDYDHDDLILLAAIVFQINILVISNFSYRLYSPVSFNQFYLVFQQDEQLKYHSVKFQSSSENFLDYLISHLNLIPPYHPFLIKHFLDIATPSTIESPPGN